MTITDAELVRALAYGTFVLLCAGATVAWWGVRQILKAIARLQATLSREFRAFDRRLTRVEAVLRLPTPEVQDEHTPEKL